jgi:serine acetyltransferase
MFGGRHEIHYQAKIGSGLKILHPSLGVVVSKWATVGTNLTLTGGNVIGGRQRLCEGLLNFGDNVYLGANAVVLGPVNIGSFVNVGAGSVVLKDVMSRMTVAGVPARPLGEPS